MLVNFENDIFLYGLLFCEFCLWCCVVFFLCMKIVWCWGGVRWNGFLLCGIKCVLWKLGVISMVYFLCSSDVISIFVVNVILVVVIGFLIVYWCILEVCYFCLVRCLWVDIFLVDFDVVWWMFFFVIFVLFVNLFIDECSVFLSWFVIGWLGFVILFVFVVFCVVVVCVVIVFFLNFVINVL